MRQVAVDRGRGGLVIRVGGEEQIGEVIAAVGGCVTIDPEEEVRCVTSTSIKDR